MLLTEIENRINQLEQMKNEAAQQLKKAPAGELKVYHRRGAAQYWLRKDFKGEYLSAKRSSLISELVRKEYNEALIYHLDAELFHLNALSELIVAAPWEKAFQELSPEKQKFTISEVLSTSEYVENWLRQEFEKLPFDDNAPVLLSAKNERMRSKSEILISNVLSEFNIPYLYEKPLTLHDGKLVHPDFTILNINERLEIIWEHFGLMDDPQYRAGAFRKLRSYNTSGFFEGDNLIISYETGAQPLDMAAVRQKVKAYLL